LPAHLRYDCERLDISVGIASLASVAGETGEDGLMRRAEESLRLARARGDGVVVAEDDSAGTAPHGAPRTGHDTVSIAREAGVPYLADPAAVATASAGRLLSPQVARGYQCFPVAFEGGALTLAMVNPVDAAAIHAVSQLTGMAVYPVASPRAEIARAIAQAARDGDDGHEDGSSPTAPGRPGGCTPTL